MYATTWDVGIHPSIVALIHCGSAHALTLSLFKTWELITVCKWNLIFEDQPFITLISTCCVAFTSRLAVHQQALIPLSACLYFSCQNKHCRQNKLFQLSQSWCIYVYIRICIYIARSNKLKCNGNKHHESRHEMMVIACPLGFARSYSTMLSTYNYAACLLHLCTDMWFCCKIFGCWVCGHSWRVTFLRTCIGCCTCRLLGLLMTYHWWFTWIIACVHYCLNQQEWSAVHHTMMTVIICSTSGSERLNHIQTIHPEASAVRMQLSSFSTFWTISIPPSLLHILQCVIDWNAFWRDTMVSDTHLYRKRQDKTVGVGLYHHESTCTGLAPTHLFHSYIMFSCSNFCCKEIICLSSLICCLTHAHHPGHHGDQHVPNTQSNHGMTHTYQTTQHMLTCNSCHKRLPQADKDDQTRSTAQNWAVKSSGWKINQAL